MDLLFKSHDLRLDIQEEFSVLRCGHCGLAFTRPQPRLEEFPRYYPDGYHFASESPPYNLRLVDRLFHAIGRKLNPGHLEKFPEGRILDVGCGSGLFAIRQARNGHEVIGIELDPRAVDLARSAGLEVLNEDFVGASLEPESFSTVVMRHSLEHMYDLVGALEKAHDVLKPAGVLYLCLPNAGGLLSRIFGRHWFAWDVPRHLYHLTQSTLVEALHHSGFEIAQITYDYSSEPQILIRSLNYLTEHKLDFLEDRVFRILHVILYPLGLFLAAISLGSYMQVYARRVEAKRSPGRIRISHPPPTS